jgi:hypothetical protein
LLLHASAANLLKTTMDLKQHGNELLEKLVRTYKLCEDQSIMLDHIDGRPRVSGKGKPGLLLEATGAPPGYQAGGRATGTGTRLSPLETPNRLRGTSAFV